MSEKNYKGGLYDPQFEHDACGVGFVANINGARTNKIIRDGLEVLVNLSHRGAKGAEENTGDGAGILMQIPHEFLAERLRFDGFTLPEPGDYGVGMICLPKDAGDAQKIQALVDDAVYRSGQKVLFWREVPTDNSRLGRSAKAAEPAFMQVFVGRAEGLSSDDFERTLLLIRKRAWTAVGESSIEGRDDYYVSSMSSRTVAYKGMLSADQVETYFPDLQDSKMTSALALVHQRFSTNTFPSWRLAHPFRYVAHNGEINTLGGNTNWMRARQGLFRSDYYGDQIKDLFPVVIGRASCRGRV